jgi:hypothetical protein
LVLNRPRKHGRRVTKGQPTPSKQAHPDWMPTMKITQSPPRASKVTSRGLAKGLQCSPLMQILYETRQSEIVQPKMPGKTSRFLIIIIPTGGART